VRESKNAKQANRSAKLFNLTSRVKWPIRDLWFSAGQPIKPGRDDWSDHGQLPREDSEYDSIFVAGNRVDPKSKIRPRLV